MTGRSRGAAEMARRFSFRPRLRTILLAVNFTILLLPLGGLTVLRFYDNALIQQTESELIAQGAVLSAAFKQEMLREIDVQTLSNAAYGLPVDPGVLAPRGGPEAVPGSLVNAPTPASSTLTGDQAAPPLSGPAIGPASGPVNGPLSGPANGASTGAANGLANEPVSGAPIGASTGPVTGPANEPANGPVSGAPNGASTGPDSALEPVAAHLDLGRGQILPRPPKPIVPAVPADPVASAAGARITPLLIATRNVTLAGIRLLDYHGTVVATTRGELGMSVVNRQEVARALRGQEVSILRERISDETPPPLSSMSRFTLVRVFVVMPVVESGRVLGAVVLSRSPLPVAKALYEHRSSLLLAAAILLLMVLLMTLVTSLTIARPVQALIRQTESLSRGEQGSHTPLERPVTWEIAQLSEAFASMARSLEQRSTYIRTFASNVSHEFKTPLTSIRGSVELLKDHLDEMSPAERDRFLENLEADARRLDRLVRRLLDLARADVLEPAGDRVHALELLGRVVERFRRSGLPVTLRVDSGGRDPGGSNSGGSNSGYSDPGGSNPGSSNSRGNNPGGSNSGGSKPGGSKPGGSNSGGRNPGGSKPGGSKPGEEVSSHLATRQTSDETGNHDDQVRIDAETLESILSNLLDNARQHAGAGAQVDVLTRRLTEAGRPWIEIEVRDDGPGISPANAARVFDPFFTTARDHGGTGLGLSIVRSLLAAHGGSITLIDTSIGTAFRVRLPVA